MRERIHVAYIDGLRAIAVLGVLTSHAFWPAMPAWFPSGTRGVELFFVVSGLCLALPFLREHNESGRASVDFVRFLVRRFVRIAPPFYAALILFGILGLTSFGYPTVPADRVSDPSAIAHEFLADFLFAIPRAPIHNVVFWTLAIEARWYLVCPLLVLLYIRSKPAFGMLALALYVVYFSSGEAIADVGTLPCFMLGIVAADLAVRDRTFTRYAWILAIAALIIGGLQQGHVLVERGNPIWHLAAFAAVVAAARPLPARLLSAQPLVAIGVASYSIYLVHAPFIVAFHRAGIDHAFAAGAALAVGFTFWLVIERPAVHAARHTLARFKRVVRRASENCPRVARTLSDLDYDGRVLAPEVLAAKERHRDARTRARRQS